MMVRGVASFRVGWFDSRSLIERRLRIPVRLAAAFSVVIAPPKVGNRGEAMGQSIEALLEAILTLSDWKNSVYSSHSPTL